MAKILITGSSGFVGYNILKKLIISNTVYATSRKNITSKHKNLKYIHFKNHEDLNLKLRKIKVDTIIHCATHYIKSHHFNDVAKIMSANLEFGTVILENLKTMNVKKFVNFCTVWQNFNSTKYDPFNLYSASKNAFLNILRFYQKNNKDIKYFNLYISDTFGPNDNRVKLSNILKNNFSKRNKIKIISKNLSINLINIKDIVSAIEVILFKNINQGSYNITNKNNFLIKKIISKLKEDKKFKISIYWGKEKKNNIKIYKFKNLPFWKPRHSKFNDLINFIIGQS